MKRLIFVLLVLLLSACGGNNNVAPTTIPTATEVEVAPATPTEDVRLDEAMNAIATQQAQSDQLSAQLTAIAELPTPTPVVMVVAPTATPVSAESCEHWGYIVATTGIYQKKPDKNGDIKLNNAGHPFAKIVKNLGKLYPSETQICVHGIYQFDGGRVWKLYYSRVDSKGNLRGAYDDWKWCCYIPRWAFMDVEDYWEQKE